MNTFVLVTLILSIYGYADCVEDDCENRKVKFAWANGDVYEGDLFRGT